MVSLQNMNEFVNSPRPLRVGVGLCCVPEIEVQSNGCLLDRYPDINLKNDIFNVSSHKIACVDTSSRNLLMPVSETVLKRITRTFFESGIREALNEARNAQTSENYPWIANLAETIVKMLNEYEKIKLQVFPHTHKLSTSDIANFAETRDWLYSLIRYIAWHPHWFKLAIAGCDDIVRIYTESNVESILKCTGQKQITCMAWRPLCAGEIVVGCERGMYLWVIDSNVQLRASTHNQLIKHPDNLPITSLEWNRIGTILATGSIGDSAISIWDMDMVIPLPIKRVGPPIGLIKWSPNNAWLFTATVDSVFRVWDCYNQWEPERWLFNGGTIQSACWSPCSTFLVFVSTNEPILYRLPFGKSRLFSAGIDSKDVLAIADLSQCTFGNRAVGGVTQQLVWDPNGRYLVITFKNSTCIAVFRTLIQKFELQISPAYFVTGQTMSECPNFVCFQTINRKNTKSVLTIAWSSGRVQFYRLD